MCASVRTAFCPRAKKPRDSVQRTTTVFHVRRILRRDVFASAGESPDGRKSNTEVPSPRSAVGALSKDETFIGLIIITAIVSTNRFFKNLSGLLELMNSPPSTIPSSTVSSSEPTARQSSVSGIPKDGTVMNVTLQPESGRTHISLSDANAQQVPSEGMDATGERYQGFFDVAATAVRNALMGESKLANLQGTAAAPSAVSVAKPLEDVEGKGGQSSMEADNVEAQPWIPASEARSATGNTDELTGGAPISKSRESVLPGSSLSARPGARRALGTPMQHGGAAGVSTGQTPGVPTASDRSSPSATRRPNMRQNHSTFTSAETDELHAGNPASASLTDGRLERSGSPGVTSSMAAAAVAPGLAVISPSRHTVSSTASSSGTAQNHIAPGGAETWPGRVWPQPPAPLGSNDTSGQPELAEIGGGGGGSDVGSGGGGSGSGGSGNGSRGGQGDDGYGGRFPWVPVLLFLMAAATYPILRYANNARKGLVLSESSNPFSTLTAGFLAVSDKLFQPLRRNSHKATALRTAQQDAYAFKVAEHQTGSDSGRKSMTGKRSRVAKHLPDRWDGSALKSECEDQWCKQKWWLIISLLAVGGVAGYVWCKCNKGDGDDGRAAAASDGKVNAMQPSFTKSPAVASTASASNTDASGQSPRYKAPPGASGPSTSQQHDDRLDPRHVRHLSQEVSKLHEKLVQRDIEYSTLAKQLASLESQEASLRATSEADTQAVKNQIAEMRSALKESDIHH